MDKALVQRDAFVYQPGKTKTPLDVFETPHNVMPGQWFTYTVEGERSARCVVSFQERFRIFPDWKEKIGSCYVQRNRNGQVCAVKIEL